MVPTPRGLAHALNLPEPASEDEVPLLLARAAAALFARCEGNPGEAGDWAEREGAWSVLQSLVRHRWPWAQLLLPHVKRPERAERWVFSKLPEWEERPARPQPAKPPASAAMLEESQLCLSRALRKNSLISHQSR